VVLLVLKAQWDIRAIKAQVAQQAHKEVLVAKALLELKELRVTQVLRVLLEQLAHREVLVPKAHKDHRVTV
jgi:uncharacterized protein YajQ (UPF0234 family)